jgi:hypothetical protein
MAPPTARTCGIWHSKELRLEVEPWMLEENSHDSTRFQAIASG